MLLLANNSTGTHSSDGAEAIDFDGTNDYLSRSTDLVGNADGKTFTFSAWVYRTVASTQYIYIDQTNSTSRSMRVFLNASGTLTIEAANTATTNLLNFTTTEVVPLNTWTNILASVDLANTSNRSVWFNDVQATVAWTNYIDDNIDFTRANHYIGAIQTPAAGITGRLAHVFLDYTYRDLSIEANRRLFITADRKPALNQQALNPILYLPLNDPTQPGKNLGTGGDFALTGVVARSGRGPNQFNAPYSDLDGVNGDFLLRTTAPNGITDSKTFTVGFCFNADANARTIWHASDGTTNGKATITFDGSNNLSIIARNFASTVVLNVALTGFVVGRNYSVVMSFDMSDVVKQHAVVNGNVVSIAQATYANDTIDFTTAYWRWGNSYSGNLFDGRLGNVFFDTKYIDLSQPTNLAKFVTGTGIDAKPADLGANGELPFGTPPLMYLPMYGNNAGKNYGTGGDFTVNSGPYPGARGPNEFWGNKADFDGSTGYLARTSALAGVSDGKTFSCSFFVSIDAIGQKKLLYSPRFILEVGDTGNCDLTVLDTSGAIALFINNWFPGFSTAQIYSVMISVDMSDTAKRHCYVNNVTQSPTWATYNNTVLDLTDTPIYFGATAGPTPQFDGKLSEFYFTTDYIDFSQEANRLKFRDAFGNPVDLTPQIEAGTIPNPAIYMRFDPANLGKNSGTGGDFVKTGTILDGGQL